ncbi:MAG: tRNA uridine-5-carboxymethylaminomethyl(34) synthesis GTPase MnmE, partial [Coxiellaceae bacterium]|nr:tRNA uridine-5-carboxymethylaminomethyl(34) synthesis GTPase MnmE [Coxiellaceae bacterium]
MKDTIAAVATPPGKGGVAIVRVSGPKALAIAQQLLGQTLAPRKAYFLPFKNADEVVIDEGVALYFKAPFSFTGEDILELQGHGGPVVIDRLLQATLKSGARLANPGEFSERAFLNNKIDLAQAEAIADLINASSEQAAQSAMRSLQGEFSKKIHVLLEKLIALRMMVEAAIDFPEEEIDFIAESTAVEDLKQLLKQLETIQQSTKQG